MSDKKSAGFSIFTIIFFIFLVMKLAEIGVVADWSWWLVTAPIWAPAAVLGLFSVGALIMYLIAIAFHGFR